MCDENTSNGSKEYSPELMEAMAELKQVKKEYLEQRAQQPFVPKMTSKTRDYRGLDGVCKHAKKFTPTDAKGGEFSPPIIVREPEEKILRKTKFVPEQYANGRLVPPDGVGGFFGMPPTDSCSPAYRQWIKDEEVRKEKLRERQQREEAAKTAKLKAMEATLPAWKNATQRKEPHFD